jgi:hyperosmotically inducible protein
MLRNSNVILVVAGIITGCAHDKNDRDQREYQEGRTTNDTSTTNRPATFGNSTTLNGGNSGMASDSMGNVNTTQDTARGNDRGQLTAMDQSNSQPDMKITQDIRQALVGSNTLSFSAKNVKIITRDAQVTLKGSVKSDSEKTTIGTLARSVAGISMVDNQLEVDSNN